MDIPFVCCAGFTCSKAGHKTQHGSCGGYAVWSSWAWSWPSLGGKPSYRWQCSRKTNNTNIVRLRDTNGNPAQRNIRAVAARHQTK
mgnify:CR=1 FL=1